jgi:hypothetical protein
MVTLVRTFLERVNPYVHSIRHGVDQVGSLAWPIGVELRVPPAGGEVAAIINTDGLRDVQPRQVVFFHRGGQLPRFLPILSCQYEALQYPLLFPHGTLGWGFKESGKNLPCSQVDWYRHLFLSELCFQIFGHVASLICSHVLRRNDSSF